MSRAEQQKTAGAVIYTRVSTDTQAETGTSLAGQLELCRQKAAALNLPIVAEYEDAGISGAVLTMRPGMMSAIADIQAGRADTLICANMSRFSRDSEHQQALLKSVKAAGARLILCDMEFTDSPEGDLQFGLFGQFAQYERQVIRKRTMTGRRRRAEEGSQPMRTSSPLGYHVVNKADVLKGLYPFEELGKYHFVEPQKSLALDIWNWYDQGRFSVAGIARHLNGQGIPSPRGAKTWGHSTIHAILTNTCYKGQAVFGRHERRMEEGRQGQIHEQTGRPIRTNYKQKDAPPENHVVIPCPPLVSEEAWERVQQRLRENRRAGSGNPRRVRLLAGRVYCPKCGGTMMSMPEKTSSKGYPVPAQYLCFQHASRKRDTGESYCDSRGYRIADAERAVALAVLQAVLHPEWVEAAREAYRRRRQMRREDVDPRREMQALDRALEQLAQEQAAAIKAQIAGIMQGASPDAYAEVFAGIAARRKDMEDRRGALVRASKARKAAGAAGAGGDLKGDMENVLRAVHTALTSEHLTVPEKRDFLGRVIERVIPQKGGADVFFRGGLFGEVCAQTLQTDKTVSVGDLSSSIVHPREVYQDAIIASAASLIVAHNHPSGDPTPSAEDVSVTRRLMEAGEILGIELLDHIIIGDGTFVSLKERGKM